MIGRVSLFLLLYGNRHGPGRRATTVHRYLENGDAESVRGRRPRPPVLENS
jgi:hypothetical protein